MVYKAIARSQPPVRKTGRIKYFVVLNIEGVKHLTIKCLFANKLASCRLYIIKTTLSPPYK
jgi:hypothetical protein